jgi:hypothetical protein
MGRDLGPDNQQVAQLHGAPCWQPQLHFEGATAGVWQPQVQLAPGQGLQEQVLASVFMSFPWRGAGRDWPAGESLGNLRGAILNVAADLRTDHGE